MIIGLSGPTHTHVTVAGEALVCVDSRWVDVDGYRVTMVRLQTG